MLLFVAVFAGAARRLRVPYPILLTIIGGILGFLAIFPNVALEPNLVFFVFLPPLLFAAGWQLSWREFRANCCPICLLYHWLFYGCAHIAISELYDSLIDVKARVFDLDEENRRLKADIAKKDQVIGPIGRAFINLYLL